MEKFIITSDSTCDLSQKLIEDNNIKLVPLTITLGSDQFKDNVDIDAVKALEYVEKTGEMPKTSAVSVYEYEEFLKNLLHKVTAYFISIYRRKIRRVTQTLVLPRKNSITFTWSIPVNFQRDKGFWS